MVRLTGLIRTRVERLLVGSRDCTKLVDGVLKQVDVVRGLLDEEVPVHGVLCFVEADWPLVGGAFTTRGVQALWPKKLYPQLRADGPLTGEALVEIHRRLAHVLPAPDKRSSANLRPPAINHSAIAALRFDHSLRALRGGRSASDAGRRPLLGDGVLLLVHDDASAGAVEQG